MERKHQVFVSSTYQDLIDERKEVIHALLELDCIPAGMELFPATDEDAWSLIKEVIDGCDYYLLILAGKYGSLNSDGISYTEMEYDYAVDTNKPIITFLHENIEDLTGSRIEKTDKGKERLDSFREKAQKKHCKFWDTPEDLGGKVSRSLIQLKKRHPSPGWVPGRFAADDKMLRAFEEMRARLAELQIQTLTSGDAPPANSENLRQGQDTLVIPNSLKVDAQGKLKSVDLEVTWDDIFSYGGSSLVGECDDKQLMDRVRLAYWHSVPSNFGKHNSYEDIVIPYVLEDQIKVQLQALGLISAGSKKRAVSDTKTYWRMTSYGEKHLIRIKAIRRDDKSDSNNSVEQTV